MIRIFVLAIALSSTFVASAQHIPQEVSSEVDTVEIFIEGPVLKKIGIFHHVYIDNWDDLANLPLVKTKIDLLVKESEDWVKIGKAEIYRFKEKDKIVEIKLLEDLKPPKGSSNWSLDTKSRLRLLWKEVVE